MFNILKLNPISPLVNSVLDDTYTLSSTEPNPDGILLRSFQMADYEIGENLVAVARAGAGVNNIPLPRMTENGIVVFNSPGANANAVKELVICGLLMAARDINGGINWASTLAGKGAEVAKLVEKGKGNFGGFEIIGKTLGVVGLGAIGVLVANACNALGMNVIGYDPFLSDAARANLSGNITITNDINTIYSSSDYITLHTPLVDSTRGMINSASIALMKPNVAILNFSRAELANVSDLLTALKESKVRKYVVDFPTEEVLNVTNVIAIPHLGASTEEAEDNCAVMVSKQLKEYLENGNITNSVNFPTINVARKTDCRMTIAYNVSSDALQNITKIVDATKISYTLSSATRGTIGYVVIDSQACLCDTTEQMTEVEGIVRIRIL